MEPSGLNVSGVCPSARTLASMTYDASPQCGHAVRWICRELAEFPERHVNVERVRLDGDLSGHRTSNQYSFGMDYDPVNKVVLIFGGYSSTVVRSDTWLLALAP